MPYEEIDGVYCLDHSIIQLIQYHNLFDFKIILYSRILFDFKVEYGMILN